MTDINERDPLVDAVSALTEETTDLLKSYRDAKLNIDGKINDAAASAETARTHAGSAKQAQVAAESAQANATKQANTATSEAAKAKASADKAAQITGLDTVTEAVQAALDTSYQYAMTEAEFEARRQQNRHEYAGSGFVEWGRAIVDPKWEVVNEGLQCVTPQPNQIRLGRNTGSTQGSSRTAHSIANVDGVIFDITQTLEGTKSETNAIIFLPDCPDGTQTYDSATGEYRDYKTYSDSRYPDEPVAATHNEAVARAFEYGYVKNGDFRSTDIKHWDLIGTVNASVSNNKLIYSDYAESGDSYLKYDLFYPNTYPMVEGKEFEITVRTGDVTDGSRMYMEIAFNGTAQHYGLYMYANETQSVRFVVPAGEEAGADGERYMQLRLRDEKNIENGLIEVESITMRPVHEQVITSRQDLVFLETWLEKVSDKDIVVPFGNVQYGANTWNGIALTKLVDLGIGAGYSKFGEWQPDVQSVGHGARWTALSDAARQAFLADPANNLYYSAEHGLCQWRYRVRSQIGAQKWAGAAEDEGLNSYEDDYFSLNTNRRVKVRGSSEDATDFCAYNDDTYRLGYVSGLYASITANPVDNMLWSVREDAPNDTGGVGKNAFALNIALVQRLNSGAYHPLNVNGCNMFRSTNGFATWWYHEAVQEWAKPKTTKDCFDIRKIGSASGDTTTLAPMTGIRGSISDGYTGRLSSDPYAFYDAVYAGQVKDLRLSARKMNVNELRENAVRDAVSGTMRGWESTVYTHVYTDIDKRAISGCEWVYLPENIDQKQFNIGASVYLEQADGSFTHRTVVRNDTINRVMVAPYNKIPSGFVILEQETSEQFDTLPYCDIIGSPENIAKTMKHLGVDMLYGQWTPKIPDGSSEYSLNKKTTTIGNLSAVYHDPDRNWVSTGVLLDAVKNEVAFWVENDQVAFLYYPALANQTAPATNSVVVGSVGDVHFMANADTRCGVRLAESLTGVIVKDNATNANKCLRLGLTQHAVWDSVGYIEPVSQTKHTPIEYGVAPTNKSPAVKALTTVTEKDGLLYLQCHGSELKYDETAGNWGDNQQIPINANGDSTQTDLNGHVVKTFCHHSIMALGIAHNTNK